jgi:hypothetical protein
LPDNFFTRLFSAPFLRLLAISTVMMISVPAARAQFSANEMAPPPEMIGKVAPRWNLKQWINSAEPLETAKLRGKVIMLRFIDDRPQGASGIRELTKSYQADGLATIGIYAPSPTPTSVDMEAVKDLALAVGFTFPIGVDPTWFAVNRYYMNQAEVEPLGATFLIDRNGVVRYVQPDGRYEKNSNDRSARRQYENLERMIKTLLAEPPPEDLSNTPAQVDGQPETQASTNPAG